MPPLNPAVADPAPSDPMLTAYDQEHAVTYMRMLDADADWREAARIVLRIDPEREPDRARRAFESHLRARWAAREGYRHLLQRGWPRYQRLNRTARDWKYFEKFQPPSLEAPGVRPRPWRLAGSDRSALDLDHQAIETEGAGEFFFWGVALPAEGPG